MAEINADGMHDLRTDHAFAELTTRSNINLRKCSLIYPHHTRPPHAKPSQVMG